MPAQSTKDVYMVIGGNGFLGRHIVQQLLDRGDSVSVFDIVERYKDVQFYSGDMTNEEEVAKALRASGTTCIIHTASPHAIANNPDLFYRVNVGGTAAIIAAAVSCRVRKLVFTSSCGVMFNGEDLHGVDERQPYPEKPMDAYNDSKARAEKLVLEANGKGGLLTVSLRPAGIFGPGDRQAMAGFYQVYERGQTHFQIGDNTNLFDWTYVGNVAKAHLLAADKLETPPPAPPVSTFKETPLSVSELPPLNDAEMEIIERTIQPVDLTTGSARIPTCEARPLGPYVERPPNADQIESNFYNPDYTPTPRPVLKTRFDQFSVTAVQKAKLQNPDVHPLQVAGQVFIITNGEPIYFWDFGRRIWNELDKHFPGKRKSRGLVKLPRSVGLMAATGSEWYGYLTGKDVTFTRFKVIFSCATRWHNIEKARRVLGYEPDVGVEEGVKKTVEWWISDLAARGQPAPK